MPVSSMVSEYLYIIAILTQGIKTSIILWNCYDDSSTNNVKQKYVNNYIF